MKGSLLPVVALLAATSIGLYGCGADKNPSLSAFLTLHNQFCESDMASREELTAALQADKRFKPAAGFVGVYETKIDQVSYAVSPEIDGCTTDVMVKNNKTGKLLFTYAELNEALAEKGYKPFGKETKRKDKGSDLKDVVILEKSFIAPNGEKANLDYPADRPDQYYMTLFAKKFAKAEKSSVSMNN